MSLDSKQIIKKRISKGTVEGTKNTTKEFYSYQTEKGIRYYYNYRRNNRFVKTPTVELKREIEIRRLNKELRDTKISSEQRKRFIGRLDEIDKRDMYERYLWEKSQKDIMQELLEKREIEKKLKQEEESTINKIIELITGETAKPSHWWKYENEIGSEQECDWYALMTIFNDKTKELYDRVGVVMYHRTKKEFLDSGIDEDYIKKYLLREYEILQNYVFVGKPVKYKQEQRVLA